MSLERRRFLQLGSLAGMAGFAGLSGSAGCGNPTASSDAVAFQGWDFEAQLVQRNVNRFERQHPDIKVDYTPITSAQYVQKIVAEFTGGSEPDALYVYDDSLAGWVGAEYLQPLDGMPNLDKVYDAIYPGNAETMTFQGKRYGLPYYTDSVCLVYNAEILDKAGISAPPTSLDELTSQAATIKDKGLLDYPIGLFAQLSDTWWSWWWALIFANETDLVDEKLSPTMADDPVTRDVLTWLQEGTRKHQVIDPAAQQTLPIPMDNAFMAGRYAFVLAARYSVRTYNDPEQSKIAGKAEMAMVPSLDGTKTGTVSNTRMYCLSATTEHKEQAYELIYYLGGYDKGGDPYTAKFWFQEQGLGFAFQELANDPDIRKELETFANPDVYTKLAEVARPRRLIARPWYTEFETEMQKQIQGVLSGNVDPESAAQTMVDTAEKLQKQFS